MTTTIVTGDDIAIPVQLQKKKATFIISNTAIVRVAIVSESNNELIAGPVTQSKDTAGANWAQSLVIVVFNSIITSAIKKYGPAKLEIEVVDGGTTLTWYGRVNIVQGLIV